MIESSSGFEACVRSPKMVLFQDSEKNLGHTSSNARHYDFVLGPFFKKLIGPKRSQGHVEASKTLAV